ncbi:MAG: glutamyl-tRNA reductase [Ignavibacteriales bacterium]|nr:glutamyl-tRNA reductase [Ignavibacteriales bacterium]
MNIYCVGTNHRTAPVEVREKLWFSSGELSAILDLLKQQNLKETVLVSTCNRTELYYSFKDELLSTDPLWQTLVQKKNAAEHLRAENFYSFSSLNAVKHIFAVASGIDSMVLGDVQILNQMKEAFTVAQENHSTGLLLNRLFNTAFHVGKRARTETEIGEGAVSVSYAAAELASKIFEDMTKRSALLIGAGETGELTAKHLTSRNLKNLVIANRTRMRAEELAQKLDGKVIDFEKIIDELLHVDIVISSVESPSHILNAKDIRSVMKHRGNKPLFIIDIGVPRNIEHSANDIDNVFLHDIDDLNHIIDTNLSRRKAEIPKIQEIILGELIQFKNWHDSLEVTPTIQQLRDQFETIRNDEVKKHLHHFSTDKHEEVEILTKRIVNKILHTPMVNLKNGSAEQSGTETQTRVHIIRHLFGLDKKDHK